MVINNIPLHASFVVKKASLYILPYTIYSTFSVRYFGGWLFNAINALFGVAFWRYVSFNIFYWWKEWLFAIYIFSRGVWFLYRLDLGVSVTNLTLVQVTPEFEIGKFLSRHYFQVAGVLILILMRIPKSLMARYAFVSFFSASVAAWQICIINDYSVYLSTFLCSPLGVDMDDHEITFSNGTFFRQVEIFFWDNW